MVGWCQQWNDDRHSQLQQSSDVIPPNKCIPLLYYILTRRNISKVLLNLSFFFRVFIQALFTMAQLSVQMFAWVYVYISCMFVQWYAVVCRYVQVHICFCTYACVYYDVHMCACVCLCFIYIMNMPASINCGMCTACLWGIQVCPCVLGFMYVVWI